MTTGLKAIETVFNGFKFRSRLEARWAVFFSTLGIKYEYEKEGFDLGEAGRYLPDFWLPDQQYWIEIKPTYPEARERKKLQALGWQADGEVFLFDRPDFQVPFMSKPDFDFVGAWGRLFGKQARPDDYEGNCAQYWVQCTDCIMEGRSTFGISASKFLIRHVMNRHGWTSSDVNALGALGCDDTIELVRAYQAARQSRFEHGESGAPR